VDVASLLNALREKGVKFVWGKDQEVAFINWRRQFCNLLFSAWLISLNQWFLTFWLLQTPLNHYWKLRTPEPFLWFEPQNNTQTIHNKQIHKLRNIYLIHKRNFIQKSEF
jgi:hypothetical protein